MRSKKIPGKLFFSSTEFSIRQGGIAKYKLIPINEKLNGTPMTLIWQIFTD